MSQDLLCKNSPVCSGVKHTRMVSEDEIPALKAAILREPREDDRPRSTHRSSIEILEERVQHLESRLLDN